MGFHREIRLWELANQNAVGFRTRLNSLIVSARHSGLTCSNTAMKVTTSKLKSANGMQWPYAGISSTPHGNTAFSLMSGSIAHQRRAVTWVNRSVRPPSADPTSSAFSDRGGW